MGGINPFTDFGFKKIFGEEASKDILIDFLNAVLQRSDNITEIEFQDKEKHGDKYRDRKVIYDKLTFIYLELPKFKLKEEDLETNVEKWLYFLKHLEDFNELPNILNQPIFRKAFERAKEANLTNEERDAYEESLKSYRDNINVIDTARKEGRKEGREEEKRQIARALLDVLGDEIIAIKTGLSEEEVAKLR